MINKLNLLKKILEQNKKIDYWSIISKCEKKYNLYITKDSQKESQLHGCREDFVVTVYKKFGKELGEATASIVDFDEQSIKRKINEAVVAAGLSKNPAYEPFANYKNYPKTKMYDDTFDKPAKDILKRVECFADEMLCEVQKHSAIKFTCAEILTADTTSTLTTNLGKTLSQRKSNVYAELILTTTGKRGETEFLTDKTEVTFDKFNVKKFVKDAVNAVIDISNAEPPKSFVGPVILTGPAIKEFFVLTYGVGPLIVNSSASAKYKKVSRFELGKPIVKFKGEKLTLKSNALILQGLASSQFDANGVPSQKVALIENGIFKNHIAAKQFADYLKVKPTGALGNVEVAAGKAAAENLYKTKKPIVEVASFSWFDPSPFAGDFASEIRLGYLIKDGKRVPFKGGLLVGSVFNAVANANYSKETVKDSGYYGPKAVRFNKLTLSGL